MKKLLLSFILFFMGIHGVFALTPTIHSTETGGSWNSASTWVEGVIPNSDDIVEINGNVQVVGNTTVGGVLITGSGVIQKPSGRSTSTLIVNGDLENNGMIGGRGLGYADYFYIHFKGDVINNGIYNNVTKTYLYGDVTNNVDSSWLGNLYIHDTETDNERTIISSPNFKPNLHLSGDVTLLGDINYDFNTYLSNHTLYIDGSGDLYLKYVTGGKVLSSNTNGDGENIKIGTILGVETNIENVEILSSTNGFVGRELSVKGSITGTSRFNTLNIDGLLQITGNATLSGNVEITGSGVIQKPSGRSTSTLIVNGDLENNGMIGGRGLGYADYFYIHFKGDVINNGIYNNVTKTYIYGNIYNTSVMSGYTWLKWDKIEDYDNYIFEFYNDNEIEISNNTEYLIGNIILNNYDGIKWRMKGDGLIFDSAWSDYRCININGCNNGIDYSDPVENNKNDNGSENTESSQGTHEQSDLGEVTKETEKQANVTNSKDAGDPVNLNTGEFVYDNTLMQYSGRGLPFEFKIRYENQAYYNGPIGNNFDYNYNLYLVEGSDGTMNFHNGKLGVFPFTQSGGIFNDNLTIDASLELVDNKYVLSINNNMFYTFGDNNRVETISDLHGNTLSFAYNEDKQLITVTDTLNRVYNFDYYDHSRLQTITDFTGNRVDFTYFGTGSTEGMLYDLDTITTTNSGAVRDISFTYTISDEFVNAHNIVKLIDSENNVYVENIYDENDRVASQKYGEESIYYNYTLTASGKILENDVIDRSGNNTIYTYDDFGNTLKKVNKKVSGDSVYLYEYNQDNKLSKEILPLGNGYTYSYDDRLNLIEKRMKQDVHSEDSDDDLVTSYEYHPVFNIKTKVTQPNGLVTDITLDENGNVIQTQTTGVVDYDNNPINIVNSFEYNSFGELVNKTDANGNVTQFEYLNGNLVKTIKIGSAENIETNFTYDEKNNITSITDGEGNITHLSYDEFNLLQTQTTPEGIVSQYIYNSLNKKVNESIILADNSSVTTTYEYDILDNPTVITKSRESNRTDTVVTAYDNDSRIIETRSADNAVNTFEYNETGQIIKKVTKSTVGDIITSYTYDVNNRLITQTNPNNSTITFEYDLFDRVVKQIDTHGTYTTFSYDASGNITSQEVFDVSNTLLQKQDNTFDRLNRNIVSSTHNIDTAEILISKSKYDAVGNIIESIDPNGNITTYTYDSFNRAITVDDSLGNTTESIYNKNDKVTSTTLTSAEGKVITTGYIYDADNRVISETNTLGETISYTYNNLNQVISKTDKDGGITTYSYDYAGNMLSKSHEGKTISYTYDNNSNLQTVTDANNNVTSYSYNDISLLESITYPDGNIMSYSYDTSGNMIRKADPNGTVITSSYDDLNRLVSKSISTGSGVLGVTSENYSYDALLRLISATNSEGNDLEFDFDSLGRLSSETNSNKTINYGYDLVGNRTQIQTSPQPSPLGGEGADFVVNYVYDQNNRLVQISSPHPNPLPEGEGTGIIATYEYNSLTLLNKTLGNNLETNYGYDELLRLKSLNNFEYTYNTQGNITSNGSDTYSYDSLDRITDADYLNKHNKISAENFEYDLMGNRSFETITKLNKNNVERQKKFSYDTNNLNQYLDRSIYVDIEEAVEETGTGEIIPDTTATGSIEVIDTEIITEDEFLEEEIIEEVTSDEEEIELEGRLIYDANGNMIGNILNNKRQYIYSYDYKNRLVKIEKNIYKKVNGSETDELELKQKIVQISYDVLGRRIQKLFNNGSYRNYIYSNQHVILEENYSKKDKLKNSKQFIYSDSLDDVLSMKLIENKTRKIEEEYVNKKGVTKTRKIKEHYVETNTYYYQKDHLGSIIAITDENGTMVEEYVYDIFGKPYSINEEGKITKLKKSSVGNTRMYTGREYDRGLKLYYNRARYYDPKLARFISRDPIDIADDVNLYAYVGNNSVMFVDLRGMEKVLILGGVDNEIFGLPLGAIENGIQVQINYFLEKGYKQDNIFVGRNASNILELNEGIESGNYTEIAIVAHSNNKAIVLNAEESTGIINASNSLSLSKNLGDIEQLTIIGCMAGYGGNSIAEIIATDFDINVKAPNSIIVPNRDDNKFYYGGSIISDMPVGNKFFNIFQAGHSAFLEQEAIFINF